MTKILSKINLYFSIVLLIFLPFQELVFEFAIRTGMSDKASFWLSHWYEPLLAILFVTTLFSILIGSRKKLLESNNLFVLLIILFSILSIMFLSKPLARGIEGFRFDFIYLLPYIFLALSNSSQAEKQSVIHTYLTMSLIIGALAVVERFLPRDYWQHVLHLNSTFGWGNYQVGNANVLRSASFLGGPNQLGSYLIPAALIIFVKIFEKARLLTIIGYSILTLAIGFSYSRAALLGLGASLLLFWVVNLVAKNRIGLKKYFWVGTLTLILVAIPLIIASLPARSSLSAITHDTSQSGHAAAFDIARNELKIRVHEPIKIIAGAGIGSAGPLVFKYGDGQLPESWYLQLLLEVGIVGLLLWLALILTTSFKLLSNKRYGVMLGIIGVSITALFLHTFADNPAISYSIFIMAGALLAKEKHETHFN